MVHLFAVISLLLALRVALTWLARSRVSSLAERLEQGRASTSWMYGTANASGYKNERRVSVDVMISARPVCHASVETDREESIGLLRLTAVRRFMVRVRLLHGCKSGGYFLVGAPHDGTAKAEPAAIKELKVFLRRWPEVDRLELRNGVLNLLTQRFVFLASTDHMFNLVEAGLELADNIEIPEWTPLS